ncbi:hypothetical protein DL96DRAFT_1821165 [Flagelloscypha sp. PMI_526]|nr:hypothetical protein DL96DRAFT_1821165 [Flagelloscypha sp. PMI_526]
MQNSLNSTMPGGGKGLRVVSFDGPVFDVTALSELFILESVAGTWAWDNQDLDTKAADIRVSDFCDIVGGTGIGGFYAILFAALNMTIGQAMASYKILQGTLLTSDHWARKDHDGCIAALNAALVEIVHQLDHKIDLDGPFLSKNDLKCFICVLNAHHTGGVRALRNYRVRASTSPDCTIRQAIHATLSDGVHLPTISIHDEQFLSANTSFANPSHELMKELTAAFPKTPGLACFVNLGIGKYSALQNDLSGTESESYGCICSTEAVAQNLQTLCGDLGPCFFRLAVTTTLGSVSDNTPQGIGFVKGAVMQYLGAQDIRRKIDDIVRNLMERHPVVPLARLRSLAAEDGKAKLNAQVEAMHHDVKHLRVRADKSIFRSIRTWLTPIDQTAKLDAGIRIRAKSTCGWLLDHPKVTEWRKEGGLCWLHGGMGTGKTIITSHIIETLLDHQAECIVAYFYFEFTNPATLSEEALFRSLVAQLSVMSENISQQLYQQHKHGALQPQLSTLHTSLSDIVKTTALPVYIVIDALDEFPTSQRKFLLATLSQLHNVTNLRAMVTSRDEFDIHQALSGKVTVDFPIESEMLGHDIATFVDQALAVEKWKSWPITEVQGIRHTLIGKADGMFRMVACLMEVLNQAQTTEEMHHALKHLPSTLSDTYCYILDTIPSTLRAKADTLLRILCVAFEPLSILELSALLAVELGDPTDPDNLPVYREKLRYHEPHNIIGLGTALVRRSIVERDGLDDTPNETVVLQLSHASVKEFLLRETRHQLLFNDDLAHETTARACLALLMYNENRNESKPIADTRYARFNWWSHVPPRHSAQLFSLQKEMFKTFPWTKSSAADELKPLRLCVLEPSEPNFNIRQSPLVFAAAGNLVQMLKFLLDGPFQYAVRSLNESLSAAILTGSQAEVLAALLANGADASTIYDGLGLLCYAADLGSAHAVQLLIEKGADVNMQAGGYGSVLQVAAQNGNDTIVRYLIGKGADVNMQGGYYGSAMQAAAHQGHHTVVQYLVEKGADVNMQGGWYGSGLRAAAQQGHHTVVQYLVEKGADVDMRGGVYGSALQAAAQNEHDTIVRYLVEKGADVNMDGGVLGSALRAAAQNGNETMVRYLVEKGADVNQHGVLNGSALLAATRNGNNTIVRYLVEKGADVNVHGGTTGSALWAAAENGNDTIVRYLVENGADVNMREGWLGSALQAATRQGHHTVVQYLIKKGADVDIQRGVSG